ncbi:acylneuraminate cytidylyltransferase [Thermodesulfatator indicus DSM 15286]|uniref:Acylneuraminate cytidylyltransferase n=1 Tax=Thermodesulfatator indicus (strain DSM 15286 / JCM 11887 / CIR29812) TaxID=667014 RepID=F8A863_THEID|nr:glycosyltransferase family protein [Thermodesulfatator indicus]AEH44329.1 acylneuraminate cytidylyltransferase [Thermodesulfatator indicus DSM 15286]
MKIGAIIQARTTSTRLPKKVLKELPYGSGITVLEQVIRRVKRSKLLDEVIIATTINSEDDPIVEISKREGIKCFRGSEKNVLERYYLCAKENKVDVVVRITSDCPCIDWEVIDKVVDRLLEKGLDYVGVERSYPHGCGDVEAFTFKTLEITYKEANNDFEKEHVCPYIYFTNKDKFKINFLKAPSYLTAPDIRVTLDTEEDYALLCAVFDYLYSRNNYFQAVDIINLFKEKSWLKLINRKVLQKKIFHSLEEELEEARKLLELQELNKAKEAIEKWMV